VYKFQHSTVLASEILKNESEALETNMNEHISQTQLTTRSRHCPHSMCSRVYVTLFVRLSVCPCCRFAAVGPTASRCRPIAAWAELSSSGVGIRAVQRCQAYVWSWLATYSVVGWLVHWQSEPWLVCVLHCSRLKCRTTSSTHVPRRSVYTTHTHTRLTALCSGLPGWAGTRKYNQSGFYWSKRQWVAVASAGPYASLHLAPVR